MSLCAVLLWQRGLSIHARSLIVPAAVTIMLAIVGLYYCRRGVSNFVLCCNALMHLVLFSSSYTIMMYGLATLGRPLIDEQLVKLDGLMGFYLPAIVAWAKGHPVVEHLLGQTYNTLLPQTAVVVGVLGLIGDRKPLEVFLRRFMISAILTAVVFALWPAEGPFDASTVLQRGDSSSVVLPTAFDRAYGSLKPMGSQRAYLRHFLELRSGQRRVVSLSRWEGDLPQGLITFPSFHTGWAILMALAFWHRWWLFIPSAILDGAVVVSTMTTGWHYVSDVAAGVAVVLVAVWAERIAGRWLDAPGGACEGSRA